MDAASQIPTRVLVVDEDPVVRELLQRELGAAGYEVDILSSGDGFTADMVSLIRPDVLLIDPFIRDVSVDAVEVLLRELRKDDRLVLLLIDGGVDSARLTQVARACRADGQLKKRDLLAAPASAVGEHVIPEVTEFDLMPADGLVDAAEDRGSKGVAHSSGVDEEQSLPTIEMVLEAGLEIELDSDPPPARPLPTQQAVPKPRAKPRAPKPAARVDLLAMIEEELVGRSEVEAPTQLVEVEVNLFSRHNFYVGPTGDLRSGGVFVATALLPKQGTLVPLQLTIPTRPPLMTDAMVEWLRESSQMGRVPPGVGLSLAHLDEGSRKILEQFFRERAPLTHLPRKP